MTSEHKAFYEAVLNQTYGQKLSKLLGTKTKVQIYVQHGQEVRRLGTAEVTRNSQANFWRTFHKHRLPMRSNDDYIVVKNVEIVEGCEGFRHPYTFNTSDKIPQTFGDIYKIVSRGQWFPKPLILHISPQRRRKKI